MAFEQLGGPLLPTPDERPQLVHRARASHATDQVARARRRTSPLVEHRDDRLPPGKALVEDRQVRDDDGKEAEAGGGLDHGDEARQVGVRREVPDAQRGEARSADVQVAEGGKPRVEVGRPQEESETGDQEDSPQDEEDQQR